MELLNLGRAPMKHKLYSEEIKKVEPGKELIFSLTLTNGKTYKPVVKSGDEVKAGQAIAICQQEDNSKIYSTISGKVLQLKDIYNSEGRRVSTLIIENDQCYTKAEKESEFQGGYESFLDTLQNYSLVDADGRSLYEKYTKKDPKSIKGIIISASKWDVNVLTIPYLLKDRVQEIVEAVNLIKKIFANASIYFVFNKNDGYNYEKLQNMLGSCKFVGLGKTYMSNNKKQLIKAVMGAEEENKVIIDELQSLVNIHSTIIMQEPLLEQVISVTDLNMHTSNYKVRIGTKISELYGALGIKAEEVNKITINGIISGQAVINDQIPINQGTESLAFLRDEKVESAKPCIRCGQCIKVCPVGLYPFNLLNYTDTDKTAEFISYRGNECISCGLCSYVCPSRINLANKITLAKDNISKQA